jgi:hypothetical protein
MGLPGLFLLGVIGHAPPAPLIGAVAANLIMPAPLPGAWIPAALTLAIG